MDVYMRADKIGTRLPEDRIIDLVTATVNASVKAAHRVEHAWMSARWKYRYARLFGLADYRHMSKIKEGEGNGDTA